jgi:O-antigen/teichoic acid export membrane protein
MTSRTIKNMLLLGGASATNVAMTALQSLILGRLLNVETFGITRTATAYMIFLTMFGHFTLHNALAAFIVKAKKNTEISSYILHAIVLVAAISIPIAMIASLVIAYSGFWSESLRLPLIVIISSLPIVCITILLNACLEALGAYSTYMRVIFMTGFTPLAILIPFTWAWGLDGWLAGRLLSAILLLIVATVAISNYLKRCPINAQYFKELFSFARVQMVSGLLSLTLLSADVILLEALTHDLKAVANYGVALLFYTACAIVPTTLGRVYFKQIAPSVSGAEKKQIDFIAATCGLGIIGTLILYFAGPIVIELFFGQRYESAKLILKIMSLGLTFNFLWNCFSTINIATSHPRASVAISTAGSIVGITSLLILVPKYHATGAAVSMIFAYGAGVIIGLWLLRKRTSLLGAINAT